MERISLLLLVLTSIFLFAMLGALILSPFTPCNLSLAGCQTSLLGNLSEIDKNSLEVSLAAPAFLCLLVAFRYRVRAPIVPRITEVAFGSNGSVTFHLELSPRAERSFSITEIEASGAGIKQSTVIPVSSSNILSEGGSLALSVTFPRVAWERGGALYDFTLTASDGSKVPNSTTA